MAFEISSTDNEPFPIKFRSKCWCMVMKSGDTNSTEKKEFYKKKGSTTNGEIAYCR